MAPLSLSNANATSHGTAANVNGASGFSLTTSFSFQGGTATSTSSAH